MLFIVLSAWTTEANNLHISTCLSRTSAVMRFGLSAARGAEGPLSLLAAVGQLWGGDLADIMLVPGSDTFKNTIKMYTHVKCVSLIICKKWCTVRV